MVYVAKVLGQIFANPPFYVLRCLVASEQEVTSKVVKGKISGPVARGYVFTFTGKKEIDAHGRSSLAVKDSHVNPKHLRGDALSHWGDWASKESKANIDLISALSESGVNASTLNSLWKVISRNSEQVYKNPWSLVQNGLSFKLADGIARHLHGKIILDHPNRVEASILWSLREGVKKGHCFLEADLVFRDCQILTGLRDSKVIAQCVKGLKNNKLLHIERDEQKNNYLYDQHIYKMECEIAEYLNSPLRTKFDEEISTDYVKRFTKYKTLTENQIKGVILGLTEPVSIITGLPGTGKTTILSTLARALRDRGEKILLIAPTGIASKRASVLTGMEAQTIHRAFGAGMPEEEKKENSDYEGVKREEEPLSNISTEGSRLKEKWKYHPHNKREETVVIVDEASMVDLHLMWRILRGISNSCRVIFVGDINQLPPVGAGFSLKEIIDSEKIPRVHLKQVFRQGDGSGVTKIAHDIHAGVVPEENDDYKFYDFQNSSDALNLLIQKCKQLKLDGVDFHVISPTHHGLLGVTNLNKELRSALNPFFMGQQSLRIGKDEIRVGDRVMITQNDYELEVFNGDIGVVEGIFKTHVQLVLKGTETLISLSIPRERVSQLLRLAYATTVHKSQGQEYHSIVMPLVTEHGSKLLQRNLLYTAVTRASDKVYIMGDREAVYTAVNNVSRSKAKCTLKKRI